MNSRARAIAIATLIFSGLIYLFAWSPLLTVKSIETSGIPDAVAESVVISKSEIVLAQRLARIEPRSAENSLREFSWIKEVNVSRDWLKGKVSIAITPRVPVALYKGKALDSAGEIFVIAGNTPSGLPTVTASTPELGLLAIELFTALPDEMRSSLISLSASQSSAISSWQQVGSRKVKVMWGSAEQVDLKVSVYQALLALPENKSIKRVDLSAPHAPIVK
ncbi:FtsQ Cell division septal protein [Candidatus Nanopelagicaceae bacterium]